MLAKRVAPNDDEMASEESLNQWILENVTTGHHSSGTCKMGPATDPTSVVDQYGRVHGLDGLRVADASIMPDVVRVNPNATCIMIGEKVSDFIRHHPYPREVTPSSSPLHYPSRRGWFETSPPF